MSEFAKSFNISLGVISAPIMIGFGLVVGFIILCCGCTFFTGFISTLTEIQGNVP